MSKAVIGNVRNGNFWLYDSEKGFDLTRPDSLSAPESITSIHLRTTRTPITIDPAKSALVIIDMQNFFLSPALGRSPESKGLAAQKRLLEYAIPAARKSGIQIAWLNWGLSEHDLDTMPPATLRGFGFSTMSASDFDAMATSTASPPTNTSVAPGTLETKDLGKQPQLYKGLGQQLGNVTLTDGKVVPAGRMLMARQWNTELSDPLSESYHGSLESSVPDVWLNKSRLSGLHVPDSPAGLWFQEHGIKTLFFAGVNTDQCVNASMCDAYCQGYDCILLRDGCATSSLSGAQECVENNAALFMGFVIGCQDFSECIDKSLRKRRLSSHAASETPRSTD